MLASRNQTQAEKITGFIWMVHDSSNACLVNTDDGDVLINTGFSPNAEKNRDLLSPHCSGALKRRFALSPIPHGERC